MYASDKHGGDQCNLGPESPATSGKQPVGRRKSSMRLELLEMEDEEDLLEEGTSASRRPSTCSLSRFRSCPQLAAAAQEPISPGMEVRDLEEGTGEREKSPTLRRRLHIDEFDRRSATPTPPSTPGSRRSHMSLKESSQSNRVSGMSPTSTPKLSRRSKRDLKYGRRTSSGDSATNDRMSFSSTGVQISLRDESFLRSDDLSDRFSKPQSDIFPPEINVEDRLSEPQEGDPTSALNLHHHRDHHHHSHHSVSDDSNDKCQRWLQSLKISRADRIKSRSHIQLPPL